MLHPLRVALVAALIVLPALVAVASVARADDNAEAAALFASANQHVQAATRLRGARRTRELEAALADYFASLRLVRSRNVVFNASIALEMLDRLDEAWAFLAEYLAVPGLSDAERAAGTERLDALRPRVAVLRVTSTPPGAEIWVDRRDLASRGRTPVEVAVAPGEHRLYLRRAGHRDAEVQASATMGASTDVSATLVAMPVSVQVLAPAEPRLTLDGAAITPGSSIDVAPGSHVLRLEVEGVAPIERRFEVLAGADPMVIDLGPAVSALARGAASTLTVESDTAAQIYVDGLVRGHGTRVEVPMAEGTHEVRVVAPGRVPYVAQREFAIGERPTLRVRLTLAPQSGGLDPVRGIFGVAAAVGVVASAIATVWAWQLRQDYDANMSASLYSRLQEAALGSDIGWGITAALGVTAIILALVDDSGTEEPSEGAFEVSATPTEGGAYAQLRLSWEGL